MMESFRIRQIIVNNTKPRSDIVIYPFERNSEKSFNFLFQPELPLNLLLLNSIQLLRCKLREKKEIDIRSINCSGISLMFQSNGFETISIRTMLRQYTKHKCDTSVERTRGPMKNLSRS